MMNGLSGGGHVFPWFQAASAHWENRQEAFKVSGNETATSEPHTFHQAVPVQRGPNRYH